MNISLKSEIHNFEQPTIEEFVEVKEKGTKLRKQVIKIVINNAKNTTKF